ncbi:hypothetical protein MMC22_007398 [Lobaria immixta]|nr:hypothetical protein [Lobaria immixta]
MGSLDSEDGDLYEALDRLKKQRHLEPDPEKRRLCWELLASYRKAESERIFRIQTERAIEKGFSSREQFLEHEREEERQHEINQETYMMKKAAELGITYAELYAQEYPQPDRCIRRYRPRCDCEKHAIPIFCPRTLLSYRSMDAPDLMEFLEFRRRADMNELRIEQGAESKRLAEDKLESYWDMEEEPMKLPFWAEDDEVLQQILRTKPMSNETHSDISDQFTPNSIFTEDREPFKDTATASTSVHPSPETEPGTWLSLSSCKSYILEMETKEASMLLSNHIHQAVYHHTRHKSLPNMGTKNSARLRTKMLRAREKPFSAVLKSGKVGPRPNLHPRSYSRPSISV